MSDLDTSKPGPERRSFDNLLSRIEKVRSELQSVITDTRAKGFDQEVRSLIATSRDLTSVAQELEYNVRHVNQATRKNVRTSLLLLLSNVEDLEATYKSLRETIVRG
ncbi:hypothetical protein HY968_02925 [Candidatus Kaiserbacteria bacterium]|nr:hypothetical protein [Candidatus Kaiserbacteria bacterium]